MTEARLRRVVRASALYDLLVTWPFATPWTFLALHGLLQRWHEAWALPGAWPVMTPLTVLMANLMGTVPSVVFGGVMTLLVVVVIYSSAPKLRRLKL